MVTTSVATGDILTTNTIAPTSTCTQEYTALTDFATARDFAKGQEMGWFQHGSTILVFAPSGFTLAEGIAPPPEFSRPEVAKILNPAAVRPTAIDVIHSQPAGDRVFQLRNLTGLGAPSLFLRPLIDGSKLDIQGNTGLRFDLNLRAPLGQGEGRTSFVGLATQTK